MAAARLPGAGRGARGAPGSAVVGLELVPRKERAQVGAALARGARPGCGSLPPAGWPDAGARFPALPWERLRPWGASAPPAPARPRPPSASWRRRGRRSGALRPHGAKLKIHPENGQRGRVEDVPLPSPSRESQGGAGAAGADRPGGRAGQASGGLPGALPLWTPCWAPEEPGEQKGDRPA